MPLLRGVLADLAWWWRLCSMRGKRSLELDHFQESVKALVYL
jgi:hypothetical protein